MVNSLLESSASIHVLIQALSKKIYAKGQDPAAILSGGAQIHRKPLPELCYACCTLQTGDYAGISEMLKIPHHFLKLSPVPRQVPHMHVHILNDARAYPQRRTCISSTMHPALFPPCWVPGHAPQAADHRTNLQCQEPSLQPIHADHKLQPAILKQVPLRRGK